jgi:hypothetical protein
LLLQSLAFCYAVGYIANAAAQGIEISRMEYEVEGDFDARPFLGLDGQRPGFTNIRVTGKVSANADKQQLEHSANADRRFATHWPTTRSTRGDLISTCRTPHRFVDSLDGRGAAQPRAPAAVETTASATRMVI